MPALEIDLQKNLVYRIDTFSVPASSRAELEAAMDRNRAYIATLAGFRGLVVFEKTSGSTTVDLVTIAAWESQEAIEHAGAAVRAHYQAIGFDMPAMLARWGAKAELGNFVPRREKP